MKNSAFIEFLNRAFHGVFGQPDFQRNFLRLLSIEVKETLGLCPKITHISAQPETRRHFYLAIKVKSGGSLLASIINAKILDLQTCNGSVCPALRFIHNISYQRRVPKLIRHICYLCLYFRGQGRQTLRFAVSKMKTNLN